MDERKDATIQLYMAVKHFVEVHGGRCAAACGAEFQQWPGQPNAFVVAVPVFGRKPDVAVCLSGSKPEVENDK